MIQRLHSFVRLSRYQEYTVQTILLSLFAIRLAGGDWGVKALLVLTANLLGLLYVYMLNDVEDAPDDSLDPTKCRRNPIASGDLSRVEGYAACVVAATLALGFHAAVGSTTFIVGLAMLTTATIGTTHILRLKGRFVVDLLGHGFVIGTSQFLVSFIAFSSEPSLAFWPSLVAVILFSMYIELWQETRDLTVDRRAALRTSAFVLGRRGVERLSSILVLSVCSLILLSLLLRRLPFWFLGAWAASFAAPYAYRILALRPKSLSELAKGSHNRTVVLTTIALLVWFVTDI